MPIPNADHVGTHVTPSTQAHDLNGVLYASADSYLRGDYADGFSGVWLEKLGRGPMAQMVRRAAEALTASGRTVRKSHLISVMSRAAVLSTHMDVEPDPLPNFDSHALIDWVRSQPDAETAARILATLAMKEGWRAYPITPP